MKFFTFALINFNFFFFKVQNRSLNVSLNFLERLKQWLLEVKLAATGILLFLAHYALHSKKCFVSLIHSDSLYLRRPICCPYFLAFGFHKYWILLLILLSKRFGRRKERTQLCLCRDLRKNLQIFNLWRKDFIQPSSMISFFSKRKPI